MEEEMGSKSPRGKEERGKRKEEPRGSERWETEMMPYYS
jgi:hypothetical protein